MSSRSKASRSRAHAPLRVPRGDRKEASCHWIPSSRRPGAFFAPSSDREWAAIGLPPGLGADEGAYKWRQDRSRVEVWVPLAKGQRLRHVSVEMGPSRLRVALAGKAVLDGALFAHIKAEESAWTVRDGICEISMLKRSRRGHYDDGHTAASTFWGSLLRVAPQVGAPPAAPFALKVPAAYYEAPYEAEEGAREKEVARIPAAAATRATRGAKSGAPGTMSRPRIGAAEVRSS